MKFTPSQTSIWNPLTVLLVIVTADPPPELLVTAPVAAIRYEGLYSASKSTEYKASVKGSEKTTLYLQPQGCGPQTEGSSWINQPAVPPM